MIVTGCHRPDGMAVVATLCSMFGFLGLLALSRVFPREDRWLSDEPFDGG